MDRRTAGGGRRSPGIFGKDLGPPPETLNRQSSTAKASGRTTLPVRSTAAARWNLDNLALCIARLLLLFSSAAFLFPGEELRCRRHPDAAPLTLRPGCHIRGHRHASGSSSLHAQTAHVFLRPQLGRLLPARPVSLRSRQDLGPAQPYSPSPKKKTSKPAPGRQSLLKSFSNSIAGNPLPIAQGKK